MPRRLTLQEQAQRRWKGKDVEKVVLNLALSYEYRAMHIAQTRREVTRGGRSYWVGDAGTKGFPDVFAVGWGHVLALECKMQVGDPVTPEQQQWLDDVDALPNGVGLVVRPSNLWEAEHVLRACLQRGGGVLTRPATYRRPTRLAPID